MNRSPNSYESAALSEIADFRRSSSSLPPQTVSDAVAKEPVPLTAMGRVAAWGIGILQAIVIRTVRPRATVRAFRRAGYKGVAGADDLHHLSLHEVDRVATRIGRNYMLAGAALGAGAGAFGAPGVAADVPLVTALALRAVSDYAVHYGFDPRAPEEQELARSVLASSSLSQLVPTRWLLGKLSAYARPMLPARAQKLLGAGASAEAGMLSMLAKRSPTVAVRLRRALPFLGAVVGAVVNALFLGRVAQTAYMLYRERFLAARYGTESILSLQTAGA